MLLLPLHLSQIRIIDAFYLYSFHTLIYCLISPSFLSFIRVHDRFFSLLSLSLCFCSAARKNDYKRRGGETVTAMLVEPEGGSVSLSIGQ